MNQFNTNCYQLCCELIARPSITPDDASCQTIIASRLAKLNFEITQLPFEDVDNLWAISPGTGPIFCFAGHTDVVPAGNIEQWQTDPFNPTLKDGALYGRGAADMKTALAAMVVAVESIADQLPLDNGRIAFLITSDEEGSAINGTARVMQWLEQQNIKLDYCLIGEPSSSNVLGDTIKNGRRGSLNAKLTIAGTQGHIAYPHLADNPIHRCLKVLDELVNRQWDQGNDYFQPTQFQISNINAGQGVTNVIPSEVELLFNLRYSPECQAEQLIEEIEAHCAAHNLNANFEWQISGRPFITPSGHLTQTVKTAIFSVNGVESVLSTSGGTSDGRFIAPYGIATIELGVINASIHQVNEHVAIEDVYSLMAIYRQILLTIF